MIRTNKSPKPKPGSPDDELQQKIVRLLDRLEDESGARGIYKSLCKLAQENNLEANTFRAYLVRAGMPASRASEIKAVLERATVCDAFLRGVSWRKTLRAARAAKQAAEVPAAQQFIRLIVRHGLDLSRTTIKDGWSVEYLSPGHMLLHAPGVGKLELTARLPERSAAA